MMLVALSLARLLLRDFKVLMQDNSTRLSPTGTGQGILTGLIGAQGAVGVFLRAEAGSTKDNIIGAASASQIYAGGFVVAPYIPEADDDPNKVTFNDWVRDFEPNPPPARLDNTNRKSEFLAGLVAGLDTTGATPNGIPNGANITLTLDSARYNGEPLGGAGDEKDGYGLFYDNTDDSNNRVYYAGILADTDLGAPLTQTTGSVTWYGQIQIIRDGALDTTSAHNFELEITFGGTNGVAGSIEGEDVERVLSGFTYQYRLAGTYDAGGVITGTVTHESFTGADTGQLDKAIADGTGQGILTGLIGAQGAVGVFLAADAGSTKDNIINTENANGRYVGGFVVAPPVPSVATHATFKTYYAARTNSRRLHPDLTTGGNVAFVEATATSLPIDGLTFPANGNFMPVTVRLKEEATGNNGFAVMYGLVSGNQPRFRAGLLSGTDLGPALSGTSTATWAGSLHWASSVSGLVRVALDTVTVDFDNGTIKAPAVTVASDRTVAIDGLFRAGSNNNTLPVGILGGDAIYTDGVPARLPLIGLIGTEGAIGVYNDGTSVVGGFQASPN